jgi:hypothetical protein
MAVAALTGDLELANAFDGERDAVTVDTRPDAGGSAGEDHISWPECHH